MSKKTTPLSRVKGGEIVFSLRRKNVNWQKYLDAMGTYNKFTVQYRHKNNVRKSYAPGRLLFMNWKANVRRFLFWSWWRITVKIFVHLSEDGHWAHIENLVNDDGEPLKKNGKPIELYRGSDWRFLNSRKFKILKEHSL